MAGDWRDQANCRGVDPDLFHPERGGDKTQAKKVCLGCVVREPCLDYALGLPANPPGVYGGTSERQRRTIRRDRNAAAKRQSA